MKIHEQIAALRRQRGMTQEDLARALGVTNQAVSKWESGLNCPDISLLPQIADRFGVSIDQLMGREPLPERRDLKKEDHERAEHARRMSLLQQARMIHMTLLRSELSPNSLPESAAEKAKTGRWGLSCIDRPDIMSCMRGGTVLFSDNRLPEPDNGQLGEIARNLAALADPKILKVMMTLHRLTAGDENIFVSPAAVAESCRLAVSTVQSCLETMTVWLCEQDGSFRIAGEYMHFIPAVTLLSNK